jgi:hypothetical protein
MQNGTAGPKEIPMTVSVALGSQGPVRVQLVSNPLDRDRAGNAELTVGFDAHGSWLELADGLPLKQISSTPDLKWAAIERQKGGGALVVVQSTANFVTGTNSASGGALVFTGDTKWTGGFPIEIYNVTNYSHMMAFDCGGFDFPEPQN